MRDEEEPKKLSFIPHPSSFILYIGATSEGATHLKIV
jgi:hypothetical protein